MALHAISDPGCEHGLRRRAVEGLEAMMDPWWNPAAEDQASDHARRIGQTRPVTIYRLVAKGIIEERIVALHRHKRDLAERLPEGADAPVRLDAHELLELLRRPMG